MTYAKMSILTVLALFSIASLQAEEDMQIPTMEIVKKVSSKPVQKPKEEEKLNPDNGISEGFLNQSISLGALGKKQALDTPYQVNTIPREIIENSNAQGLQDVIKYIPSAQIESRGGAEIGRPQTRGFRSDVASNSFWDGLNVFAVTAAPMEQFENLQVLNGIAGTLYGPQTPSGIFNYTLKRPTTTFYNSITTSYMNDGNAGLHGDFGGKEGMVGYRINLLKQDGEGYVKNSDFERQLISTAFDFYLTDRLTLETNFSKYNYTKTGYAGTFSMPILAGGVAKYTLPSAVDSSTSGLGQEYAGMDLETTTFSTKVKYEINSNWHMETGYLYQRSDRGLFGETNTLTDNNGGYKATQSTITAPGRTELNSWMSHIGTKQEVFGIEHDISFGANGYALKGFSNRNTASPTNLGNSNIYNPMPFPEPTTFSSAINRYKSSLSDTKNITVGDTLLLNKEWQVVVSLSESYIRSYAYDKNTGARTTNYSDEGESYATSLIYKPMDNWSFYFTYADSIQAGLSGANSNGTTVVLAPSRSTQYELGMKTSIEKMDISTAVFEISRPVAYQGNNGIFDEQGEQRNRGVELMFSGRITENLSVFGGVTYLDPTLQDAKVSNMSGNQVVGMPSYQYNLLFDYVIPVSRGFLGFSSNFHYTGERAIDEANSQWVDGYFTVDLGARYITKHLLGDKTTFRVGVNNITNEKYWDSVFASSGFDGLGTSGATQLFLGEPRRVFASIQVQF